MFKKKFVEAINPMKPYNLTFEQLFNKVDKWVNRGKPVEVYGFQLFHNGNLTNYESLFDLVMAIWLIKDKVNYCTCAVCVKTFKNNS